ARGALGLAPRAGASLRPRLRGPARGPPPPPAGSPGGVPPPRGGGAAPPRRAGDGNPIHHDPVYAAGTRFGRPIASGAQTTGLLMGLTATHFSRESAMLGLDFWFRFRRPVFVDETVRLEWLVIAVRPAPRLGGHVV